MRTLLSLPPNLVGYFHRLEQVSRSDYFYTSDPIGSKLGSGGGTSWLLEECWREGQKQMNFNIWLSQEKRVLLHAGGQSRRLPGYAPSGKILTPIPVSDGSGDNVWGRICLSYNFRCTGKSWSKHLRACIP